MINIERKLQHDWGLESFLQEFGCNSEEELFELLKKHFSRKTAKSYIARMKKNSMKNRNEITIQSEEFDNPVESLEKEYRTQGFGPNVKTISHTDIDEYVEEFGEVKGLYIYMSDPSLGGSYKEIDSELLESVFKNKKLIREISRHDGGVSFFCGGSGFGSSTSYYGFYYSFDGAPKDYWCGTSFGSSELLKPDGVGFSIKYSNDDNCYYTEKIMDNFYYYEAHF